MSSQRNRQTWAAVVAVFLVSTMVGVANAEVEPSLGLEPRTGAPGTLVLVQAASCPPQPGAEFYSVHVKLLPPGGSFRDDGLAYGSVLRTLADRPGAQRFSVDTWPTYGSVPKGAAVLRDDGSWSAPLWVPYGTPPGQYTVDARCFTYFPDPDGEGYEISEVDYRAAAFEVAAWPTVPPTYNACWLPNGLFVDGDGNLHVWGWPPARHLYELTGQDGGWWPGRNLARGVAFEMWFNEGFWGGGLVIDAFGGLHRFREPSFHDGLAQPHGSPYWPGWDIARGVAVHQDYNAPWTEGLDGWGVVLDGWGGLHPFMLGAGPAATITVTHAVAGPRAYWPGWDIARDVALLPSGKGGYILDGWGGLHPFGLNGNPAPPKPKWQPYWPGWDVARGVMLLDDRSGYVVDAFGGTHSFSIDGAYQPSPPPTPYWPGQYVVQGATLVGCSG
jgi:hypothetical protein